jgi:hypothetical protein
VSDHRAENDAIRTTYGGTHDATLLVRRSCPVCPYHGVGPLVADATWYSPMLGGSAPGTEGSTKS